MRKKFLGRTWLFFFACSVFFAGIFVGKYAVPGEILPIVLYNDRGQKVCVREDAVLAVSEMLRVEIPLEKWEEGRVTMIEIRAFDEEGKFSSNSVLVERKILHNGKK